MSDLIFAVAWILAGAAMAIFEPASAALFVIVGVCLLNAAVDVVAFLDRRKRARMGVWNA